MEAAPSEWAGSAQKPRSLSPPSLMWSSPHVFNHRRHGVCVKWQALHFAAFSTQSSWLKRRTFHCPSSPTHTETLDISNSSHIGRSNLPEGAPRMH